MSKRILEIGKNSSNKKPKLDSDTNLLWDDDLDESVFDDCMQLATQYLTQGTTSKNDGCVPTYEAFKAPKTLFCSTQVNSTVIRTTTSESDLENYKIKYEEKEGEIIILRNQLREIKTNNNSEYQKTLSEYKEKLNLSERQVHSVKSELEFKNLEIMNLKQKIESLKKQNLNATINGTINSPNRKSIDKFIQPNKVFENKIYPSVNEEYPLKHIFFESFLTIPTKEKFIIDSKLNHSLKSKGATSRVVLDKSRGDVRRIYPNLLKLCNYTTEELDSYRTIEDITLIVFVCFQSLEDLLDLLEEIKRNLQTEDLLEADTLYLKSTEINQCELRNELGRKSAFILNCLSILVMHCTCLKEYFIYNKDLCTRESLTRNSSLPTVSRAVKGHEFLNKILAILNLAGEIRKSNVIVSFLNSGIKLMTNICKVNGYSYLSETVCNFTKELIFMRPPVDVTFNLICLLVEASRFATFIKFLFKKTAECSKIKNGILHFTEGDCCFYIYVLLFNRGLSNQKSIPIETCLNMMHFIYNTYTFLYSLHHIDIRKCECLPQLYKLEIELIYKMLDLYADETERGITSDNWWNFFNTGIVLKVLNLMTYHCYDLTEGFIIAYSQLKEIERRARENEVCQLSKLNINVDEDVPNVNSKKFDDIVL
ncbi:unnamed protein product [Phyllotreta striolata]|uniref:Uncharacterized protein n=1 Tax=Phyllotreta striolata TaxID=444603 RepID=A0A9N9XR12_PHYSR|nr:unnamed protein product [Phyllotreta striolata]